MNMAIASVYAITITHEGGITQDQKNRVFEKVPALIAEIQRLEDIVNDPIIRGYLEAKAQGRLSLNGAAKP